MPVVSDLDVLGGVGPYVDIGPAIGRKVLRFWPGDAARNKGSPWFPAVVTDYNELTGIHTITYGFNTTKEEYEEVTLSALDESALKVSTIQSSDRSACNGFASGFLVQTLAT